MLTRVRKSLDERDEGFTLIELLVVMIVIGILAAIAIPVFLNQRKKAAEAAAKTDASNLGKEIAAIVSEPRLYQTSDSGQAANFSRVGVSQSYNLIAYNSTTPGGTPTWNSMGTFTASQGVALVPTTGNLQSYLNWCVTAQPEYSGASAWSFDRDNGLKKGTC